MNIISLALTTITAIMLTADIIRASALRHWRDGQALIGMNLMRVSNRINPYSMDTRLDMIESLYTGYRMNRIPGYLSETVLISKSLVRDYPGSVQAWSIYSGAQVFEATHGGRQDALPDALKATRMDPLSVVALERAMFLLTAERGDYELFKTLGVKRAILTSAPIVSKCELCGRAWLAHGEKK